RFSLQMQCHRPVHSADAFVVPRLPLVSQIIGHLVTAPTRLLLCQLAELLDNGFIGGFLCLVAIGTTTDLDRATRLSFAQPKFRDRIAGQLTSLCYLESFFSMMSFSTSCSRLRFAYICFRRRFSSSSSFIRFTSLILIPPYLAFHL